MTVYCVWSGDGVEGPSLSAIFSNTEEATAYVDFMNAKHGEGYSFDEEEVDKYSVGVPPLGNPPNCLNPFHEEDGPECPCMKK